MMKFENIRRLSLNSIHHIERLRRDLHTSYHHIGVDGQEFALPQQGQFFTKIYKKLTIVILLLLSSGILIPPSVEAQTVHALLIIMDANPTIGPAIEVDREKVERLLTSISRVYRVEKTVYLSSRAETRVDNVLAWVRKVRPSRDDIIFVYYGGHGGMVSPTYRETFLQLTDKKLYRSELAKRIEQMDCRLKLLITDACSNAPRMPVLASSFAVETVSKRYIRDLFGKHRGFLHLSAATEGQYAWCHVKFGSFFTVALMALISDISDSNGDGFVTWREVFTLAQKDIEQTYEQSYPHFTQSQKADMKRKGITGQTPKAYSLPQRSRSGSGPPGPPVDSLWELRNPNAGFEVNLRTDKSIYRVNDYLTLHMTAEKDCYITVLNWDKNGKLTVLLPNQYSPNRLVSISRGQIYSFPTQESDFDFILPGPVGRERFKILAIHNEAVSQAIENIIIKSLPLEDHSPFHYQAEIIPRDKVETKILRELQKVPTADWAVAETTITLRQETR